jgi:formylglycine-generating enzyme required for sulfatase activity
MAVQYSLAAMRARAGVTAAASLLLAAAFAPSGRVSTALVRDADTHVNRSALQASDSASRAAASPVVEPRTKMTFVEIPAGRFTMGSPADEAGRNADEAPHEVVLTTPFLLGQHEVTQQEWAAIMHTRPSQFAACGPRCPVERVTYRDVQAFLRALNVGADLTYRLPTEAEWEYACRAGTATPFSTGANLTTDQANYNGNFPYAGGARGIYRATPTPAGTFAPNPWGLADMHGNVWEWTSDWYGPYVHGPAIDPHGPPDGEKKVIRGGSWYFDANSARCALHYTHAPADRGFSLGFRVAADRVTARGPAAAR